MKSDRWNKQKKGFVLGIEPSEPNPCLLCGCAMGALTVCPNTELHGKLNPFTKENKYREELETAYKQAASFDDASDVECLIRRAITLIKEARQDLLLDRSQVPDPVISFENLRNNNVLAAYTLQRNPQGLLHEISLNTAHYQEMDGKQEWKYGRWAQAESLLHEMLHLKQQKYGKTPYKSGRNSHNKEFVTMAKELGLNVTPVIGNHFQVADKDSPFGLLMRELGIQRPDDVVRAEGVKIKDDWFEIGKKRKGKSSLTKYSCGCQNAWIGSAEFKAMCMKCGNVFVQAAGLRQMIKEIAEFDVDAEMDRQQEMQDDFPNDDVDDLEIYLDRYAD